MGLEDAGKTLKEGWSKDSKDAVVEAAEALKLIKASGLKIESFGCDPNDPEPQQQVSCYTAYFKFGDGPWIESAFYSQHKLRQHLWDTGMIKHKANEAK